MVVDPKRKENEESENLDDQFVQDFDVEVRFDKNLNHVKIKKQLKY